MRTVSRILAILALYWSAIGAAAPLDTDVLKRNCVAASAKATVDGSQLASFAERELVSFKKGQVTEATDQVFVYESPTTSLFSWDKVYLYWSATQSESSLTFPYALKHVDGRPVAQSAVALEEIEAVRKAFSGDPVRREKITSALKRSAVYSTAWSAVFISTMFKVNGFKPEHFLGSPSHARYIRTAIERAGLEDQSYRHLPCDPSWVKPRVGDLVCYSRQIGVRTFSDVMDRYTTWMTNREVPSADAGYNFQSHCDVVVNVTADGKVFDSIGGNVSNSVKKTSRATSTGYVDAATGADKPMRWLAVLVLK